MCFPKWSQVALPLSAISSMKSIDDAVHLPLARLARGAADGDILQRAAEAAHGVPLEMRQDNQRIIVDEMRAHRHFLQMESVLHRQIDVALGVDDVHRAEGPAVRLQRFPMAFRGSAGTAVSHVRLDDRRAGNLRHEIPHHVPGQDVRAVGLARVQLDGDLALNFRVHLLVELDQMLGVDLVGEIDLRLFRGLWTGRGRFRRSRRLAVGGLRLAAACREAGNPRKAQTERRHTRRLHEITPGKFFHTVSPIP